MKFSDIFLTFLIILFFIGMYLSGVFLAASRQIKHNWPKHRCNPMVMPFAGMLVPMEQQPHKIILLVFKVNKKVQWEV